ncbi:MAG: hypothetical protein QOE61_2410 [Micromonosporaceae bacterium]|nr:hypothetical protein [Micromonosporaceae bacterium]
MPQQDEFLTELVRNATKSGRTHSGRLALHAETRARPTQPLRPGPPPLREHRGLTKQNVYDGRQGAVHGAPKRKVQSELTLVDSVDRELTFISGMARMGEVRIVH